MGDQPIARPLPAKNRTGENCGHISIPQGGFKPMIPVLEAV